MTEGIRHSDHNSDEFNEHHLVDPDWVILGASLREEGGVMVTASTKLMASHIERKYIPPHIQWGRDYPKPANGKYAVMSFEMSEWIVVYAPTYEEAIHYLFTMWAPKPQPRGELAAARPELETPRLEIGP